MWLKRLLRHAMSELLRYYPSPTGNLWQPSTVHVAFSKMIVPPRAVRGSAVPLSFLLVSCFQINLVFIFIRH